MPIPVHLQGGQADVVPVHDGDAITQSKQGQECNMYAVPLSPGVWQRYSVGAFTYITHSEKATPVGDV
jgi:hypothetical protein